MVARLFFVEFLLLLLFPNCLLGQVLPVYNQLPFPRIHSIGGIEFSDLFNSPVDITDDLCPWGPALGPDKQKPQSHRTFYGCFTGPASSGSLNTDPFSAPFANGVNANRVLIQLINSVTGTGTLAVKLEHPYLEIDPFGCSPSAGGLNGDCRCNPNIVVPSTSAYNVPNDSPFAYFGYGPPPNPPSLLSSFNVSSWIIPSATYFEHAPFPGQNPWMRTYQKLCIQYKQPSIFPPVTYTHPPTAAALATVNQGVYTDTTIWIAVTKCCASDTDCKTSAVAFSWTTGAYAGTVTPFTTIPIYNFLALCDPSGLQPKATPPNCDNALMAASVCGRKGYLGAYFAYLTNANGLNQPFNANFVVTSANIIAGSVSGAGDSGECFGETLEMTLARQNRKTCCGAQTAPSTISRDWLGITSDMQKYGTCIDTSVESCCGWKPFNPRFESCCSKYHARINNIDQPCKCSSESELFDCRAAGANSLVNYGTTGTAWRGEQEIASAASAQATRLCCTNVKYAEFIGVNSLAVSMRVPRYGNCYDLNDPVYKCCDDGNIYDMGSQQCCVVNGVQSLNVPCPCSNDAHCNGVGSYFLLGMAQTKLQQQCCIQQWPRSWSDLQSPSLGQCDKYANYPDGTAPAEVQRCVGNCIDSRFQSCCNGHICAKKYERCCNSTCCNRFTHGCMEGTRPGSRGFGGRINPNDFMTTYETCSSIEVFTTRRAFWVWVMPTFWCIATAVSAAIVTVVARRATENSFPLTERCMVFFAVLLVGLSAPHYFSPTYKYGVVIVYGAFFTMIGAVMQSRRMSLLTIFVLIGMLILWIDPFNGNIYLSLPGGVAPAGAYQAANPEWFRIGNNPLPAGPVDAFAKQSTPGGKYYSGILEALFDLERNHAQCTSFYDFFTYDPFVHDMERFYNPAKTTFGFCTRAWMTTLLIFSCASLAIILVLLMLSIFSYSKKVIPKSYHEDTPYPLPMDTQAPY